MVSFVRVCVSCIMMCGGYAPDPGTVDVCDCRFEGDGGVGGGVMTARARDISALTRKMRLARADTARAHESAAANGKKVENVSFVFPYFNRA